MPITAAPPIVQNLLEQGALMFVDGPNGPEPLCHILGLPPCDWEPGPPACPRNLPDSSCNQSPPTPTACGPSTCSWRRGTSPSGGRAQRLVGLVSRKRQVHHSRLDRAVFGQ